jgi:hypothetical protein
MRGDRCIVAQHHGSCTTTARHGTAMAMAWQLLVELLPFADGFASVAPPKAYCELLCKYALSAVHAYSVPPRTRIVSLPVSPVPTVPYGTSLPCMGTSLR